MFHDPTKEKMACTATAGFRIGRMITLKVWNSPEPSMRAASISSFGRLESMYCFMKKNTVGAAMLGKISGHSVLVRCILSIRRRKPSADTCIGIVIMSRMMVNAAFLNLKS